MNDSARTSVARRRSGWAGVAGVAVSLGLTELFAGWSTAVPSAISAIGGFVIDLSPSWLKTFAISTFGTADKAVLAICIVGVALLIGWFVGKASAQRPFPMVIAFAAAASELHQQCGERPFTHIVFASSSGGTQAGLMLGKQIFVQSYHLIGIKIDKEDADHDTLEHKVLSLAYRTAALVNSSHEFSERELILNSSYLGAGYGVIGELEREAILLTARTEGILLDPVYTGRAMGGMICLLYTSPSPRDKF